MKKQKHKVELTPEERPNVLLRIGGVLCYS